MYQRSADRKAAKKNATKAIKKIVEEESQVAKIKKFSQVSHDLENPESRSEDYDHETSRDENFLSRPEDETGEERSREHRSEDYEESSERRHRSREDEEETYDEPAPSRKSSQAVKERKPRDEEEFVSKSVWQKLLKKANIVSASGDVLEALKQIVPDFLTKALNELHSEDKVINSKVVDQLINKWIPRGESEIVEQVILPSASHEYLIRPAVQATGFQIKRDGFYQLIHFVETWMIKLLTCGDIIAEASKRTRICGRDISVAYTIKMQ